MIIISCNFRALEELHTIDMDMIQLTLSSTSVFIYYGFSLIFALALENISSLPTAIPTNHKGKIKYGK